MLNKIRYITGKKYFHICITIFIVVAILFVLGIVVLKYNVEGETNMPFELGKIAVISSSEGIDKEEGENRWNFDINQNNDIYLYINKNKGYSTQEAIKSVRIDNINVEREKEQGTINFYRPNTSDEGGTFKNTEENLVTDLEYNGDMETDLKTLKISNQGGLIVFRCAIEDVAEYSSDDEEINHSELLKKAGINEEYLKIKLTFDLTITIESAKEYKANISLDLPIQGVVENGNSSQEITDLKDMVFKRTKN